MAKSGPKKESTWKWKKREAQKKIPPKRIPAVDKNTAVIFVPIKKETIPVIIDREDLQRIEGIELYIQKTKSGKIGSVWYYDQNNKKTNLSILLKGIPPNGYVWDHINHIVIDYRKSNLQLLTIEENCGKRIIPKKHKIINLRCGNNISTGK